jgi:hypothetical protein
MIEKLIERMNSKRWGKPFIIREQYSDKTSLAHPSEERASAGVISPHPTRKKSK